MVSKDDLVAYLADDATALPPSQHIAAAGKDLLPPELALEYVSQPGDGRKRYVFRKATKTGDRGAWDYIKRVLSGDITKDNPDGRPAL